MQAIIKSSSCSCSLNNTCCAAASVRRHRALAAHCWPLSTAPLLPLPPPFGYGCLPYLAQCLFLMAWLRPFYCIDVTQLHFHKSSNPHQKDRGCASCFFNFSIWMGRTGRHLLLKVSILQFKFKLSEKRYQRRT